jgi:hypothetical protein
MAKTPPEIKYKDLNHIISIAEGGLKVKDVTEEKGIRQRPLQEGAGDPRWGGDY